jgi:hypothetical protein
MTPEDHGPATMACECGHPIAEHAWSGWGENTVCVEQLPTFPEGGWYGVCPCVRHGDDEAGKQ